MTHSPHHSKSIKPLKTALVLALAITASACSSTQDNAKQQMVTNKAPQVETPVQQMNGECQQHALAIADNASTTASRAQYLTSARALDNCVAAGQVDKADKQNRMQMIAITTLNFIKGGDVQKAAAQLAMFKRQYPQQDLYFADYTSFVDSATALLNMDKLSATALTSLNINRKLRAEIERNHYWLSH